MKERLSTVSNRHDCPVYIPMELYLSRISAELNCVIEQPLFTAYYPSSPICTEASIIELPLHLPPPLRLHLRLRLLFRPRLSLPISFSSSLSFCSRSRSRSQLALALALSLGLGLGLGLAFNLDLGLDLDLGLALALALDLALVLFLVPIIVIVLAFLVSLTLSSFYSPSDQVLSLLMDNTFIQSIVIYTVYITEATGNCHFVTLSVYSTQFVNKELKTDEEMQGCVGCFK